MRNIRRFEPADLPIIQSLRRKAFEPIFASFCNMVGEEIFRLEFSDWDQTQGDYLHSICATHSGKEVYVVTMSEQVVAFIGISMNRQSGKGEIDLNAVDPSYQGQGIGRFMYEFAIRRMKETGVKVVKVSTGADSSHAAARRAYERAGFGASIPSIMMYQRIA